MLSLREQVRGEANTVIHIKSVRVTAMVVHHGGEHHVGGPWMVSNVRRFTLHVAAEALRL